MPDRAGDPPQEGQVRPTAQPVHGGLNLGMPAVVQLRKGQLAIAAGQRERLLPAQGMDGAAPAGGVDLVQAVIDGQRLRHPKPLPRAAWTRAEHQAACGVAGAGIGKVPAALARLADSPRRAQLPLDTLRVAAIFPATQCAAVVDGPGQKRRGRNRSPRRLHATVLSRRHLSSSRGVGVSYPQHGPAGPWRVRPSVLQARAGAAHLRPILARRWTAA